MTIKEFVAALQICIQDEFISQVKENVIQVRFPDGQLIKIAVTEQEEKCNNMHTSHYKHK